MSEADTVRVLGICGSLRKTSHNFAALSAAGELMPPGMSLQVADISDFPLYHDDIRLQGYPPPLQRFRAEIAAADAILFATPEYNWSIPGVLKNAIDWASRPPDQPFAGKPYATIGAATGILGTARAQFHLRQICASIDMISVIKPEVFITFAATKFDAEGRLIDQATRDAVAQLMQNLRDWSLRLRRSKT
jgi:chromate reductase, NAD(P)H dehydrogenase (quinone)